MVPCCSNYAMSRKCYISAWKRFYGNALYGDCLVEKPQKCQQQTLIILFVPVWKSIFIPLVSHISAPKKQQKNNPNMKWYKMIYERGSLERRSSSWKSNKHPLPMGWTRRWYVQEAFSQDDHVLNRLPLLKYSWAEIYSLIFHYLLPLLCILQEFSTSAAHPLPPSAVSQCWGRVFRCPLFRHSVITWSSFFFSSCQWQTQTAKGSGVLSFKAQGFKQWRCLGDRTSQSLLKLNRITSSTQMFVSLQTCFHLSIWLQVWQTKLAAVKKKCHRLIGRWRADKGGIYLWERTSERLKSMNFTQE